MNKYPTYITVEELMQIIRTHTSRKAFLKMARSESLPRRYINDRVIVFEVSEVEKWLRRRARG